MKNKIKKQFKKGQTVFLSHRLDFTGTTQSVYICFIKCQAKVLTVFLLLSAISLKKFILNLAVSTVGPLFSVIPSTQNILLDFFGMSSLQPLTVRGSTRLFRN